MSSLTNQLVIAEREDVSRGIRLLLATPLITQQIAPEAFDLIRRRRDQIRRWFDYYCGWSLVVEPRLGYARLAKVATTSDPTRPARRHRSGRAPFDRRRYVLICVVAAELLAVPVTTIGLLADRVGRACSADGVLGPFETASRAERMAFVDVLRLLEDFGAIETIDGATDSFVDSAAAKVLYRVDSTLLMRLLVTPVGVSQLAVPPVEVPARFEELLSALTREQRYGAEGAGPVSEVQRNLWLRHRVFRRLADDPVLYLDDLTPDERAYLCSPTGRQLLRRAADQAGFVLEERAEGVMLIDPDALATDAKFPDDAGTDRVAALLLLDVINESVSPIAVEQLRLAASRLLAANPKWARGYREDDGAARLVTDALAVLGGLGLVRAAGALVHRLPAAARYAIGAVRTRAQDNEEDAS